MELHTVKVHVAPFVGRPLGSFSRSTGESEVDPIFETAIGRS
jgi:hypothetical protein